jgi:hypothetical protein
MSGEVWQEPALAPHEPVQRPRDERRELFTRVWSSIDWPVSQATVTLPVREELARITGVFVTTPSATSDHSMRVGAAVARGAAVRQAGRREVARPFRRRDLETAGELADVHRRRRI